MATVQAMSSNVVAPAQARSARAAAACPPPSSGLMHTRPWRSSPLAGPAFSTLPHAIPESTEEAHENDLAGSDGPRTRSPSIVSQTGSFSASTSGYASRNASGSASALALADGEASTSSVSLAASTVAHGTSSSHTSSQSHPNRSTRLSKSWGRHTSVPPKNVTSDVSIKPPPRARTVSHGHSRSTSFIVHPLVPSPTIPQAYSRSSPRPTSVPSAADNTKQPPSKSRDPASNWMSSSPFGPAQTPKFSRLAMASPAVVMPLSAKEYRKQKARESVGGGKETDSPFPNHVTFIDNALSAFPISNGVPAVKVSPPPSEDVHQPPSSGDHIPDPRSEPQPHINYPPSKLLPQTSMSPRPTSPKQKRPRSRPNTPPRSSPLVAHPPISPKSSAGTFFSFASSSEEDSTPQGANKPAVDDPNALPPARPRLRPRRRKSYPDRLSNGARLSLLEAMNRLSQESASLERFSQQDGVNRLSMASQASGHTLFYDVGESVGEQGQLTSQHGKVSVNGIGHADGTGTRTPVLTQSLEDLSSTLTRTGIEVVRASRNGDGNGDQAVPSDEEEHKVKRNVRMVRISDTVEVSPPPVHRRRKLTKSRPDSTRLLQHVGFGSAGLVKEVKVETPTQAQERRTSLLPWKSKGSADAKASVVSGEKGASAPTKGLVHRNGTTTPALTPNVHPPIVNGSPHVERPSKPKSDGPSQKTSSNVSTSMPTMSLSPDPGSSPSTATHKPRRYTFSFLPTPTFHRPKRGKSNSAPASVDLSLDHNNKTELKGCAIGIQRSGTDSTSTSIRTITQGSQSTLVPTYDLTTLASSGGLSGSWRGSNSSVPMLRRLNAQETTTGMSLQNEWDGKGASTPSLITNGSTATTSGSPRTPSFYRISGGEPFAPRLSGLKESYTDMSEDDSEGMPSGRTSRMCMHRKPEPSPLARAGVGWGEVSEEDERHLRPSPTPRSRSRPGTSDSTLTTATETSGSYQSFSTVPASTSSSSTSRSESPSHDKRDEVLSVQDGDEDEYACVLCGHRSTSPPPLHAPSPASMRDPELEGMHPMFTVPLVTIPASVLDTYSPSRLNTPFAMQSRRDMRMDGARCAGGRENQRRQSVPVPAALIPGVKLTVPAPRPTPILNHVSVNANGELVGTMGVGMGMGVVMNDKRVTTTTHTMTPPPLLVPPPHRIRKQHRPQTAPAGTGDAALRFIEDAKAMRVREGGIDIDALIRVGSERGTRHKSSGESKFKSVLRGLLRWGA